MEENYYIDGYDQYNNGYTVKSRGQGSCRVGTFVCEEDARDFCTYRNYMLNKYDTSDVSQYWETA